MIRHTIVAINIGSDAWSIELAKAAANHNNGELIKTTIKQFDKDGK